MSTFYGALSFLGRSSGPSSHPSAHFLHHALLLVPGFSPAVSSSQKCISRGELQVSLSYQPVAQRMTVVVLKARHLPKMDITGLSGSSYLLQPTSDYLNNPLTVAPGIPDIPRPLAPVPLCLHSLPDDH